MQATLNDQTGEISLLSLLSLYAIIPVGVIICLLDQKVWNYSVLVALPFRPEIWLLWCYVFGMPHLFAGIQMLAEKEYFTKYGWRLGRIMAVCLAIPFVVGHFVGDRYVFLIFAFMIMYHTVAQQFGLTITALKKRPSWVFFTWKWAAVMSSTIYYVMLYLPDGPLVLFKSEFNGTLFLMLNVLMTIATIAFGWLVWDNRQNKVGVLYLFANMALLLANFYFFVTGYYFLTVVMIRVIHEVTAWPIYCVHDRCRNRIHEHNIIYRAIKKISPIALPQWFITLAVAFGVGSIMTALFTSISALSSLLISFSLYHYYSEHFLWRHESLLRKSVRFV